MSVGMVVTLSGWDELQGMIARFVHADHGELLDDLGGAMVEQTHERLRDTKESPDGDPWEDLTDAWVVRKKKGWNGTPGSSGGLLDFQGDLNDSIQWLVDGGSVEVGSNVEYAATHQFGDDERGIPARPYLGLSGDNEDALVSLTENWLHGLAEGTA